MEARVSTHTMWNFGGLIGMALGNWNLVKGVLLMLLGGHGTFSFAMLVK